MLPKGLLILAFVSSNLLASNQTTALKRPLVCYHADSDRKNLAVATTFATVWYVVPYRVLPPILAILKNALIRPGWEEARVRAALIKMLDEALGNSEGGYALIPVAQAGSIISFLVPLYWINQSYHSEGVCQHALDSQVSSNTTRPLSCYVYEKNQQIFKTSTAYAFGLSIGVYNLMPIVFSMVSACFKKHRPIIEQAEPVEPESGGCCKAFSAGFEVGGSMTTGARALVDSAQWVPILAFLTPLIGWAQLFRSQSECEHDEQDLLK